ncbi:uncharacterized protein V6R79_024573 [Siganus canaliculatus]
MNGSDSFQEAVTPTTTALTAAHGQGLGGFYTERRSLEIKLRFLLGHHKSCKSDEQLAFEKIEVGCRVFESVVRKNMTRGPQTESQLLQRSLTWRWRLQLYTQRSEEPDMSTGTVEKKRPCVQHHVSDLFPCFHRRINKIMYSPNVAPLFSDCESSTHTVAFYHVNTFQDLKTKKNQNKTTTNKYRGIWRD